MADHAVAIRKAAGSAEEGAGSTAGGERHAAVERRSLTESAYSGLLNRRPKGPQPAQPAATANRTGLPDTLKANAEALSGVATDDVRVHLNSPRPAQLQAHAYTQGSEIHVAPGREKHLPHELWHVVQQKQGRVRPTSSLGNLPLNDDPQLESEADAMAAKLVAPEQPSPAGRSGSDEAALPSPAAAPSLQRIAVLKLDTEPLGKGGGFGAAPVQRDSVFQLGSTPEIGDFHYSYFDNPVYPNENLHISAKVDADGVVLGRMYYNYATSTWRWRGRPNQAAVRNQIVAQQAGAVAWAAQFRPAPVAVAAPQALPANDDLNFPPLGGP